MAVASAVVLPPESGMLANLSPYQHVTTVSDITARTEVMMRNSLRLYSIGDEEVGAPSKVGLHAHAPGAPKPDTGRTPPDFNQDRQQPKDTTAVAGNVQVSPPSTSPVYANPAPAADSNVPTVGPPVEQPSAKASTPTTPSTTASPTLSVVDVPDQLVFAQPNGHSAVDHASSTPAAAAERLETRDARPQGKSAAAEVLQLCQRQGIPLKLPELHMQPQHRVPEFVAVSTGGLAMAAGVPGTATAPGMQPASGALMVPSKYNDLILGNPLGAPLRAPYSADMVGTDPTLPLGQEVDPSLPVEQQLAAALADRARLVSALQSLQGACVRKDEQVLDMQQREELLQQQHLQLQSMYQGLLDQLQREQQQWASDCSQLQGELRTKQNVEELTKLLTNQLRQEQRQKKNVMAQLQAENSARQQLQDQLVAARVQLQKLQANAESVQWLQTSRNKLQNDLSLANAHLQMERQRNADISMQVQSVLAVKQQLQQEVSALRMQLQQRMPGPMDGTAGAGARAADANRSTVGYSQAQYMTGYADSLAADLQYQHMNTTMAAVQLPGSPTSYVMQSALSMPMTMQDPSGFPSMMPHQY